MKSFVIFAIVLTVVYVIYYTVVIVQDLYGKPKEEKSQAESFDLSDMTDEDESITVTESEGGFSVGDNRYDTSLEGQQPTDTNTTRQANGVSVLNKVNAKLEGKLEEVQATSEEGMYSDELFRLMMAKGIRFGHPQVPASFGVHPHKFRRTLQPWQ